MNFLTLSRSKSLFGTLFSLLAAMAASLHNSAEAGLVHTYEAAGVQSSTASNTTVIDFESASTGYHGSQTFTLPGNLTATYVNNQFVYEANVYGGANGSGNYLTVTDNYPVTLTLTQTNNPGTSAPQAYFGMWLSAADAANKIEFFLGDTLIDTFTATSTYLASLSTDYYGNPNASFLNGNVSEPYVFVNFYSQDSSQLFDKIVFTNITPNALGSSLESDNHTFSTTLQPPAVPEPSTGLLLGLGTIGFVVAAYRRRQSSVCSNSINAE